MLCLGLEHIGTIYGCKSIYSLNYHSPLERTTFSINVLTSFFLFVKLTSGVGISYFVCITNVNRRFTQAVIYLPLAVFINIVCVF